MQPVFYPVKSTPIQAMSSQFLQENAVGNHVKGFVTTATNKSVEVSECRKANVALIFKKDQKEDAKHYKLVSLSLVPWNRGFTNGKSYLTNLIAFCDETTGFVDKGRTVNVIYFDFSKALDTVSHNILVPNLGRRGLDGWKLLMVIKVSPCPLTIIAIYCYQKGTFEDQYLIQTSFKYLQGWRLNHFPGQSVPMLDNPLGEEKFPNIQSKPPLAQLEAISSCPITCYLGEETDPHLSTTSCQVVVESDEVSPQPPFLQAKQSQLPQPLLRRLLLQTLHQLRCPSLYTLQYLNIPLVVGGPKLNTVFEVRPHQCRVQGHNHFPSPAGHAIFDTGQDAIGLLGRLGTLLAHIQAAVNKHPQVLLCQAAFQPLFPKPVALHGVAVAQVQDPALGLVKPHTIHPSPSIQPVQVPLQSLPTLQQINTPTQLGVVCKLTESALDPFVQIIDKDVKQNWPQHRALGNTACDWPPTGFNSIHHHPLGPAVQPVLYPAKSNQFLYSRKQYHSSITFNEEASCPGLLEERTRDPQDCIRTMPGMTGTAAHQHSCTTVLGDKLQTSVTWEGMVTGPLDVRLRQDLAPETGLAKHRLHPLQPLSEHHAETLLASHPVQRWLCDNSAYGLLGLSRDRAKCCGDTALLPSGLELVWCLKFAYTALRNAVLSYLKEVSFAHTGKGMTFQSLYPPPSQTTQILLVQVEVTLLKGDRDASRKVREAHMSTYNKLVKPMVKTMVRQAVPLQPMEVNSGADIHLQPVQDPTPEQVGAQRRL
ncbi:hypothetical protein QYF61_024871 [Mycteria americana]|uniref:Uncharacterized protein n=1 Tax=Mycteria americana TaxID=33587 RepID=A0AAN7NPU7_MYCAM|nr:hypothetical protein QYF61_024871 [Mycteria americana]